MLCLGNGGALTGGGVRSRAAWAFLRRGKLVMGLWAVFPLVQTSINVHELFLVIFESTSEMKHASLQNCGYCQRIFVTTQLNVSKQ